MRRGYPTSASSPRCATSPSTAATTPPTPPKRPRSPATSAGPTAAPDPSSSSPSAPRSADPITYPTLLDAALASHPILSDQIPTPRSENQLVSAPGTRGRRRCVLSQVRRHGHVGYPPAASPPRATASCATPSCSPTGPLRAVDQYRKASDPDPGDVLPLPVARCAPQVRPTF